MHVATDGGTYAGSRVMLVHGLTDTKSPATSSPPAAGRSLTHSLIFSSVVEKQRFMIAGANFVNRAASAEVVS